MNDHRAPLSAISTGGSKHQPAKGYNPSGEPSGRDYITRNVKYWIIIPVLIFQGAGFGALVWITYWFMHNMPELPAYVWVALIGAIAGMPFAFALNVKRLIATLTVQ